MNSTVTPASGLSSKLTVPCTGNKGTGDFCSWPQSMILGSSRGLILYLAYAAIFGSSRGLILYLAYAAIFSAINRTHLRA
jgi:hypothetical protein